MTNELQTELDHLRALTEWSFYEKTRMERLEAVELADHQGYGLEQAMKELAMPIENVETMVEEKAEQDEKDDKKKHRQ